MKFQSFSYMMVAVSICACEANDSQVQAAKVDAMSTSRLYQLTVNETHAGWGEISLAGQVPQMPQAITACIGHQSTCERGMARSFVLWASDETRSRSDSSAERIPAGTISAQGATLKFPFPVQFAKDVTMHITTYYTDVRIIRGWLALAEAPDSDAGDGGEDYEREEETNFDGLGQAAEGEYVGSVEEQQAIDIQQEQVRLAKLKRSERRTESYRIYDDWQTEAISGIVSSLGQIANQPVTQPVTTPSTTNNPQPPATTNPSTQPPSTPSTPLGNTVNEDVLNQGATNYCWGYSAFHMLRQYYFATDRNGAWSTALAKINTTEGMANYMRSNHANQGNNMMTWIRKFKGQNPDLPADGWSWHGTISSAATKLQQNPPVPSSYCDGRHCTALIEFSNGQFTVADSAGGYTYKASPGEIGDYSTVSLP